MEERQVGKEEAQQILTYALDLGERMLKRGAEVGRVEDTITRILTSQGAERVDVPDEPEFEDAAVDYDEEMTGGDMTDDYMTYGGS